MRAGCPLQRREYPHLDGRTATRARSPAHLRRARFAAVVSPRCRPPGEAPVPLDVYGSRVTRVDGVLPAIRVRLGGSRQFAVPSPLWCAHHRPAHGRPSMRAARITTLACALRSFFTQHLPEVRGASPHTVRSYRDSLALLLRRSEEHT